MDEFGINESFDKLSLLVTELLDIANQLLDLSSKNIEAIFREELSEIGIATSEEEKNAGSISYLPNIAMALAKKVTNILDAINESEIEGPIDKKKDYTFIRAVDLTQEIEELCNQIDFNSNLQDMAASESPKILINRIKVLNRITSEHEVRIRDLNRLYSEKIESEESKLSELSRKIDSLVLDVETPLNQAKKISKEKIIELEKMRTNAAELLEIITKDTVSGSYEENYKQEKKLANNLRWGAILFLGLITGSLIFILIDTLTSSVSWEDTITRIAITILLMVPFGYLAKESDKHRSKQHDYTRVTLQLRSIDPFIANLDIDKQMEIKEALAKSLFTNKDMSLENQVDANKVIVPIIEAIQNLLIKLK